MFWYNILKKKKSKYKIMNEVLELVNEYHKIKDSDKKDDLRVKVKSLYEQMDDIEREIHEIEQIHFFDRGSFIYCDCGNDLGTGTSDILNQSNTKEVYKCDKCGMISEWRYDAPVPIRTNKICKYSEHYLDYIKNTITPVNIDKKLNERKDNIDAEINSKMYASKYIDNDGDI